MARRRRRSTPPKDYGTPEVQAKQRTDPVKEMVAAGRLRPQLEVNALEIAATWAVLQRCFLSGGGGYEPAVYTGAFREPADRMSAEEIATWKWHYMPWATKMARNKWVCGRGESNQLDLVLLVVVDGAGPRECDKYLRVRPGKAFELLRDGLEAYV